MEAVEEKLFILDLLKLNKSEKMYSEESVINIIKQVLKMNQPVTAKTEQETNEQPKRVSAEEFVKNKLNEKTGQGITLYEHYLAYDTTISIGTAVSWMTEFASQHPIEQEKPCESAEEILYKKYIPLTFPTGHTLSNRKFYIEEAVIEAMEEYASQKHLPTESTEEVKCVAGCKRLTGHETIHHKDCPYYPESFTKMYDDLKSSQKHLPTDGYPKEFCIWIACNVASYSENNYNIIDAEIWVTTLDELFIYWKDKIK